MNFGAMMEALPVMAEQANSAMMVLLRIAEATERIAVAAEQANILKADELNYGRGMLFGAVADAERDSDNA